MRKLLLFLPLALFASAYMTSCLKGPDDNPVPKEGDFFDFSTTKDFNLTVDYKITHAVSFAVFTEYPYTTDNTDGVTRRVFKGERDHTDMGDPDRIEPIFRAITDSKGAFTGVMNLPKAVQKIWVWSQYMGVPEVLEMDVDADMDNVTFQLAAAATRSTRAAYTVPSGVKVLDNGTWDEYGVPSYKLADKSFVPSELFQDLMYSFPNETHVDAPRYLNKEANIVLTESSEINLVFVHDGGMFKNAVGYYSYPTSSPPASASAITKIIAFPNLSYVSEGGNLTTGDQVKLKYWNPTTEQFENKFPANHTIGFFLYANGFEGNIVNGYGLLHSNKALNANSIQQSVMLRDPNYDYEESTQMDIRILAFEDMPRWIGGWQDHDFNDAIMLVKIKGASKDVPDITPDPDPDPQPDPIDNYFVVKGTLAFEDLWPQKGDYDMNDVVIEYHCTVMRDKNNRVVGMIDSLRPRWSGAEFHNGFGYQLGNLTYDGVKDKIQVKVRTNYNASSSGNVDDGRRYANGYFQTMANGLEAGPSGNGAVIMVFEDIKPMVPNYNAYRPTGDKPRPTPAYYFTVVTSFGLATDLSAHPSLEDLSFPPYNPFTVVTDRKESNQSLDYRRTREIHLPNFAPTKRAMELSIGRWFMSGNDRTQPNYGLYYVSDLAYPWGINIPIYNWNFPIEEKRIDDQTFGYPRFSNWVESQDTQDRDWYLYPASGIGSLPN